MNNRPPKSPPRDHGLLFVLALSAFLYLALFLLWSYDQKPGADQRSAQKPVTDERYAISRLALYFATLGE